MSDVAIHLKRLAVGSVFMAAIDSVVFVVLLAPWLVVVGAVVLTAYALGDMWLRDFCERPAPRYPDEP